MLIPLCRTVSDWAQDSKISLIFQGMNDNYKKGKSSMFTMIQRLFSVYIVLGFLFLLAGASPSARTDEVIGYRLPTDITPEIYQLGILTDLGDSSDNFTFEGRVCIQVICNYDTDKIILHSKNLEIIESDVSVRLHNENESSEEDYYYEMCGKTDDDNYLKILSQDYHEEYDLYIIRLSEKLQAGSKYRLYILYRGELGIYMSGFYRSSYKDLKTGKLRWIGATQFESTDARKAFPCFDEPIFKARFQINLGHFNTRNALSNMPQVSTKPIEGMEGWVWDQFQITLPMSTYLVAFVLSDFTYKKGPETSNNVLFRVWARKDAIEQVDSAAFIGPKILAHFEDYFKIKYPLPKQDMIAIPDFNAGAMENWGLITYREVYLLHDSKVSTGRSLLEVVSTITHELAHQWFGNLVTMKWWTDLWLNEGFATYVAALGVHHLYPEWDSLDERVTEMTRSVFSMDALRSSHPVSVPIGHPREIDEIFDAISYEKGSCVIRMMNAFLGEDTFREGVTNYLRENAYKNAEQNDLWRSLTEVAHKNKVLSPGITVKDIMDTWTLQTGFPVISVIRNYKDGTARVTQERYLAELNNMRKEDKTTWWVPLSYTTEQDADFNDKKPKVWIPKTEKQVIIDDLPTDGWVIMNVQLGGIYRVNYDVQNWERIIKTLKSDHKKIGLLNRAQLIEDSFALANVGQLDFSVYFNLLTYMRYEREYLPWKVLNSGLLFLNRMLKFSGSFDVYRAYLKDLLRPIYESYSGFTNENDTNFKKLKLQRLAAKWACKYGSRDYRAKNIASFNAWMKGQNPDENNPIPLENRTVVYCMAIKYGGEEEWDFLWDRYLKSNVGSEKSSILSSLACTTEFWLLNRYLEWSLTKVRLQDTFLVFTSIARNDVGYFLAKHFFENRISDIYKAHGGKGNRLGSYITELAKYITSQEELDDLKNFTKINEKYLNQAKKAVKRALETARINVQWQRNFRQKVGKILEKMGPNENL